MEKLRMYNPVKKEEEKEPLKTPLLTIRAKYLCAVNEEGYTMANLWNIEDMIAITSAKELLTRRGFRTDWAIWTEDGRFDGLIEDVEG